MMRGPEVHVMFGSVGFPRILGLRLYGIGCVVVMLVAGASAVVADTLQVPSADYPTIQSAIDAAVDGDTVQVAAGTYYGTLVWYSKSIALLGAGRDVTVIDAGDDMRCAYLEGVPDTARIEGFMFTGRGRYYVTGVHLIDSSPMIVGNTFTGNRARYGGGLTLERSSATLVGNLLTDNSGMGGALYLLESYATLSDNTMSGNSGSLGGAVCIADSEATLTSNIITHNYASDRGGALYLDSSRATLTDNTISYNYGGRRGGALRLYHSRVILRRNIISGNRTDGHGGAIDAGIFSYLAGVVDNVITDNSAEYGGALYLDAYVSGTLDGNTIARNSAETDGGGVYLGGAGVACILRNNSISHNTAGRWGGGLYIGGTNPSLTNNTIFQNSASEGGGVYLRNRAWAMLTNDTIADNIGGGLYQSDYYAVMPELTNCILWGNGDYDLGGAPVDVTYSDIGVGFVEAEGNISADPMFVGGGDYHLQSGSPCIDAGDSSAPDLLATDKDGNPRIVGAAVDMGAYEWQEVANQPPVAEDDAYSVDEDNTLAVPAPGVLDNDSDPEGHPLTAALIAAPANGTLTLNADGSFEYTPDPDFNGADSFTYKANDGALDSNEVTVTITVNPVNDAPVAVDDAYSTDERETLTVDAPGVLGNDSDVDGDPLTAILMESPSQGMVTFNPVGSFTYEPASSFTGTDTFTYVANDSQLNSNVATVTITVTAGNIAPVAVDDAYLVDEDNTLSLPAPGVLGNDSDVNLDPLTAALVTGTSNGTLTLNPDGCFSYTPALNFWGTDSFTYVANDGPLDSNVATVTITVKSVNDPPVAVDDEYTLEHDSTFCDAAPGVLRNDIDPDTAYLIAIKLSLPSHGWAILAENGAVQYTPDPGFYGTDSFIYKANDGHFDSNIATVTLNVTPPDDLTPPEILDLQATPDVLKANHKIVEVTLSCTLVDACDPNPTWCITSVSSNEPESGLGNWDRSPDWQIVGDHVVLLRCEHSPKGDGRIYTITVEAADASGNCSTAMTHVRVPKGGKK